MISTYYGNTWENHAAISKIYLKKRKKMKHILVTNIVLIGLLTACSNSDELALAEPQAAVESLPINESSNEILEGPVNRERNGENAFPGFDLEAVAVTLGVSVDNLSVAIEANRSQREIDLAATAAQLGIEETALKDALGGAGFGHGKDQGAMPPNAIDYAAAAVQLNLPESDIQTALENSVDETGHQNFDQAAAELGIEVKDLMDAVGMNSPKGR